MNVSRITWPRADTATGMRTVGFVNTHLTRTGKKTVCGRKIPGIAASPDPEQQPPVCRQCFHKAEKAGYKIVSAE